MATNLTQKIIADHLLEGRPVVGEEVAIRIDHTLLSRRSKPDDPGVQYRFMMK